MTSSPRRTLTALISATAVCAVLGTTAAAQPAAQRLPKDEVCVACSPQSL